MRVLTITLAALSLAGCHATPGAVPPNYAAIVGMVQTDYVQVKVAAAAYCAIPNADAKACAMIAKTEAVADPLVASLTATTAPSTIVVALQDVVVILTAPLPTSAVSAQTQADLHLGLTIVAAALQLAPSLIPLF